MTIVTQHPSSATTSYYRACSFAMDDGGRCLLDVINDPKLLQSFLESGSDESKDPQDGTSSESAVESPQVPTPHASRGATSNHFPSAELLLEQPDPAAMGYSTFTVDALHHHLAASASKSPSMPPPSSPAWSPAPSPARTPVYAPQKQPQPLFQPAVTQRTAVAQPVVQLIQQSPQRPTAVKSKHPQQILPKPAASSTTTVTAVSAPSQFVAPTSAPKPQPPPPTVTVTSSHPRAVIQSPLVMGQPGLITGPQGTILLNQLIPGQSPILIQPAPLQLAVRPPASPSPSGTSPAQSPALVAALQQGHQMFAAGPAKGPQTIVIPNGGFLTRPSIMLPRQHQQLQLHQIQTPNGPILALAPALSSATGLISLPPQQPLFPFAPHDPVIQMPQPIHLQPVEPPPQPPSPKPSVNLELLLKEHGIVPPDSPSPPPSPPPPQLPEEHHHQIMMQPQQLLLEQAAGGLSHLKLSITQDGTMILQQPPPQPRSFPQFTTTFPTSTTTYTAVSPPLTAHEHQPTSKNNHSALIARLNAAPALSVPDLTVTSAAGQAFAAVQSIGIAPPTSTGYIVQRPPTTVDGYGGGYVLHRTNMLGDGYFVQRTGDRIFVPEDAAVTNHTSPHNERTVVRVTNNVPPLVTRTTKSTSVSDTPKSVHRKTPECVVPLGQSHPALTTNANVPNQVCIKIGNESIVNNQENNCNSNNSKKLQKSRADQQRALQQIFSLKQTSRKVRPKVVKAELPEIAPRPPDAPSQPPPAQQLVNLLKQQQQQTPQPQQNLPVKVVPVNVCTAVASISTTPTITNTTPVISLPVVTPKTVSPTVITTRPQISKPHCNSTETSQQQQPQQQVIVRLQKPLPPPPAPPSCPTIQQVKTPSPVKKVINSVPKTVLIEGQLSQDQQSAVSPDVVTPFRSRADACRRLLSYHVYDTEVPSLRQIHEADESFDIVSSQLLSRFTKLRKRFRVMQLKQSMRHCQSSETILIERLFYDSEKAALEADRFAALEAKRNLPPPTDRSPNLSVVKLEPLSPAARDVSDPPGPLSPPGPPTGSCIEDRPPPTLVPEDGEPPPGHDRLHPDDRPPDTGQPVIEIKIELPPTPESEVNAVYTNSNADHPKQPAVLRNNHVLHHSNRIEEMMQKLRREFDVGVEDVEPSGHPLDFEPPDVFDWPAHDLDLSGLDEHLHNGSAAQPSQFDGWQCGTNKRLAADGDEGLRGKRPCNERTFDGSYCDGFGRPADQRDAALEEAVRSILL